MEIESVDVTTQTLDLDEQALILACQKGDRKSFAPLVTRYMRRAAGFALAWTGNHDDALDLSQEAFARAFKAIDRFDTSRPFYPWFHRILKNLCLNYLGRAARLHEVPLMEHVDWADRAPRPDELVERKELRKAVWESIRKLGAPDREILILREFQHLTYAEIAEVLDIPRGTVMSRLHQARSRLRGKLEPFMTLRREGGRNYE
jgi:RNA polymerase sigma-70 factor, ECF subfamily